MSRIRAPHRLLTCIANWPKGTRFRSVSQGLSAIHVVEAGVTQRILRVTKDLDSRGTMASTARQCAGVGPFEFTPRVGLFNSNGVFDISSFLDLGVGAPVSERIARLGITEPLPIQAATIPDALAGRDICGQAPTGSGKTLAFGIPLVTTPPVPSPGTPRAPGARADPRAGRPGAETYWPASSGPGQTGRRRLRRDRVRTTSGRRCSEASTSSSPARGDSRISWSVGDVHLSHVRTVVLDEADRMVDMGFLRPVCRLLDQTAPRTARSCSSPPPWATRWSRSAAATSTIPARHRDPCRGRRRRTT